jgi:hypothetical protein
MTAQDERFSQIYIAHRRDVIWDILSDPIDARGSLLKQCVASFIASGASELDLPLQAMMDMRTAPLLKRRLQEIRYCGCDLAQHMKRNLETFTDVSTPIAKHHIERPEIEQSITVRPGAHMAAATITLHLKLRVRCASKDTG